MQWKQSLLLIGFLLMALGSILIMTSSNLFEDGFFFIFPFFFVFGDTSPLSIGLLIAFAIVFFVLSIMATSAFVSKIDTQQDSDTQNSFIQVSSKCVYCSKRIPVDSSYCPFCGSPVSQIDGLD